MSSSPDPTLVGCWRYPVKSMMGEALDSVSVGSGGIPGDRGWAVRDEAVGAIRGAKKIGSLMRLAASYVSEPATGSIPHVEMVAPDGSSRRSDAPDHATWLSELLGREVTLWPLQPPENADHYLRGAPDSEDLLEELRDMFARTPDEPLPDFSVFPPEIIQYESPVGTYFDAYPILVLTTNTLARLSELAPDSQVDVRRFRPNLVIDLPDGGDFPEQDWVGESIRIGEVELDIVTGCPRCVMITRGFDDLPEDRALMRTVVAEANQNAGVYATVRTPGTVTVGDRVTINGS